MLLAIETSSLVSSVALLHEDSLRAELTIQAKLTHSEQLIPHLDNMMKDAGVSREEVTAVACSLGPGSFTGLRMGLASIKMMACIWDVPLIGVDTLEALAWNMAGGEAYALPIMDAQRGNVYAALYSVHGSEVIKGEQETVISIDELTEKVSGLSVPVTALGEAADKYADKLTEAGITLAPPAIRCCRAGSVAMAAWNKLETGKTESPLTVTPNYIRRSEAEVQWELRHREK